MMMKKYGLLKKILLTGFLLSSASQMPSATWAEEAKLHPLQVHMAHWLRGSGKWRSPHPDYDPDYDGPLSAKSFKFYEIEFRWKKDLKTVVGKLKGIFPNEEEMVFWDMYYFHNPVTNEAVFQQVGRNGTYISGRGLIRTEPLPYGAKEHEYSTTYGHDGSVSASRHENIFLEDGTQQSKSFVKAADGTWKLRAEYVWTLTSLEKD